MGRGGPRGIGRAAGREPGRGGPLRASRRQRDADAGPAGPPGPRRRGRPIGDDAALKGARAKAAAKLVEAQGRLAAAARSRPEAEALAKAPLTTSYTPRPLQFPRAKTTYRDVPPNTPYPKVSTGRRLALARWIVDRRNPLAARVAVNHVWARHFGEPLVASMFDFGLRRHRPELADLLDWLAVELIESGWSMKHLHRLIVTSEAYRMRSSGGRPDDPNARIDPDNHYVWRMNAEAHGGRGHPRQPALPGRPARRDDGRARPAGRVRRDRRPAARSTTGTARDERIPFLTMFDAPNVEECYRRDETIVPQQALAMINSGMVLTRAGRDRRGDRPGGRRSVARDPGGVRGRGLRTDPGPSARPSRAGRMRGGRSTRLADGVRGPRPAPKPPSDR